MLPPHDVDLLVGEHGALMRHYGQVQLRCGELLRVQAGEIEALRAQAMRLRAAVIVRDTALAWAREQRDSLEATIPGLHSLAAANLVICQTGCLSQGAYWRVHDMCRRTGKLCVFVGKPDALAAHGHPAAQPGGDHHSDSPDNASS